VTFSHFQGISGQVSRKFPSCAVFNNDLNQLGVAVSRGAEKRGLDYFQLKKPLTSVSSGDFQELSEQLPFERTESAVNTFHEILAVGNKTELLLYGGQINDTV
jgi:hypothetical protein